MTYVFYDVETTGLKKRYDQIVSFAAIKTDNNLNIQDSFEIRIKVSPHIIPSPGAIHVTGVSLEELFDPRLPSHFEGIATIHAKLLEWAPALFLGFNSISFDEEMLRNAFYQALKPPYITSINNSGRADVLGFCRITAALRPNVLVPAIQSDGRRVFRLAELAAANGLAPTGAHGAMIDANTTLSLCRHIKNLAPDLWSQFPRFTNKASVKSFIQAEDAFVFFDARAGGEGPFLLTSLGQYSSNPTRFHCLNPLANLDYLANLSDDELKVHLNTRDETPLTCLRINTAPMMTELFVADSEHLGGLTEDEILARVARIRDDPRLGTRILNLARTIEPEYSDAIYVEDQLYDGFPEAQDELRMAEFHSAASWQRRAELAREFVDPRLRQLSQRILHFSGKNLLGTDEHQRIHQAIQERLKRTDEVPWLTVHSAQLELEQTYIMLQTQGIEIPVNLIAYQKYLQSYIENNQ